MSAQTAPVNAEGNRAAGNWQSWLFLGMVASLCIWVLQLPMFPMQDGPMHLYLAKVLGDMLSHAPASSVYAQYYSIQHLLPPYSLHYYLLILLMKWLSALWAEKIVICLVLMCFCTGVRHLAIANGASGGIFGLFGVSIALNWPLVMGFQNFILSLGLACWALGFWSRQGRASCRLWFLCFCGLAAITHPVPLLLVLGFVAADLGIRAVSCLLFPAVPERASASRSRRLPRDWWRDAGYFAVAAMLVVYLHAFTDTHRSAADIHFGHGIVQRARYFGGLHGLDFFNRTSSLSRLLQVSIYLILLVCAGFASSALLRSKRGSWKPAYTWLLVTIVFTCALPFLPDELSGSRAFTSRLQVVTWIGAIAAASGFSALGKRWSKACAGLAVATLLCTVVLGQSRLTPVARRIVAVEAAHIPVAGKAGLLLSAAPDDASTFADVTYEPLHWQAVEYFRRTDAVLLNTPWMDSTWLPLTATPRLLTDRFTPWTMECYHCLRQQLVDSSAVRDEVLPRTDFIVFVDQPGTATQAMLNQVLLADPHYQWACQQYDWLWLCRKLESK